MLPVLKLTQFVKLEQLLMNLNSGTSFLKQATLHFVQD